MLAMACTSGTALCNCPVLHQRVDNDFLNFSGESPQGWGCVFAEVVEGMDVVDKIVATGRSGMHPDVPKKTLSLKA